MKPLGTLRNTMSFQKERSSEKVKYETVPGVKFKKTKSVFFIISAFSALSAVGS